MARPPASAQVQVNFRMPADLKARIEAAAQANSRSTTAEIVATLEERYPPPAIDTGALLSRWKDLLDEFSEIVDRSREATDQDTTDHFNREMDRIEREIEIIQATLSNHL